MIRQRFSKERRDSFQLLPDSRLVDTEKAAGGKHKRAPRPGWNRKDFGRIWHNVFKYRFAGRPRLALAPMFLLPA